jgi:hypothetical protein
MSRNDGSGSKTHWSEESDSESPHRDDIGVTSGSKPHVEEVQQVPAPDALHGEKSKKPNLHWNGHHEHESHSELSENLGAILPERPQAELPGNSRSEESASEIPETQRTPFPEYVGLNSNELAVERAKLDKEWAASKKRFSELKMRNRAIKKKLWRVQEKLSETSSSKQRIKLNALLQDLDQQNDHVVDDLMIYFAEHNTLKYRTAVLADITSPGRNQVAELFGQLDSDLWRWTEEVVQHGRGVLPRWVRFTLLGALAVISLVYIYGVGLHSEQY